MVSSQNFLASSFYFIYHMILILNFNFMTWQRCYRVRKGGNERGKEKERLNGSSRYVHDHKHCFQTDCGRACVDFRLKILSMASCYQSWLDFFFTKFPNASSFSIVNILAGIALDAFSWSIWSWSKGVHREYLQPEVDTSSPTVRLETVFMIVNIALSRNLI